MKEQLRITDYHYPLNIFDVCSHLKNVEIRAVPFKTHDLRGMVAIAQNDAENHAILVNSNKSFEEQNFHGFHELIHIPTADKPGTLLTCYDAIKPNQDSYLEWLANEGAAEFTVPYRMLLPTIKEEYSTLLEGIGTWNFCLEQSERFCVSPIVIQNRIKSLKYEIKQYMNGVPLDEIEILSNTKLTQRGFNIKSLVDLENERLLKMWFGIDRSNGLGEQSVVTV